MLESVKWVDSHSEDPDIVSLYTKLVQIEPSDSVGKITGLSYFKYIIKKNIEDQFEFEFDAYQVSSSLNLLCYLAPAIRSHPNAKEEALFFTKMALNLNESCEAHYKPLLVRKILDLLCVFSDLLLNRNPFLQEVL